MDNISNSYTTQNQPRSTFQNEPVIETRKETPKVESKMAKGLQLGKSKKVSGYSQVLQEENVQDTSEAPVAQASQASQGRATQKVHVAVLEKIVLSAENDGGLKGMEVKGELVITVNDNNSNQAQVHINQGNNKEFQFKTHPNMNKNLYTQNQVLALNNNKAYPIATPSSVLKWRWATKDESSIPLTINVWSSTSAGETSVPVEYEKTCDFDLVDVDIAIPIPGGGAPVIGDVSGNTEYDSKRGILHWKIPLIDKDNKSGTLEFVVPASPNSAFFPVKVNFSSTTTFAPIQVVGVTNTDNSPIDYSTETSLTVEQYDIE